MYICTMMCGIKGTARVSIRHIYTLAQPIHPVCMVARTTNASVVANWYELCGKHWLIESWYKSVVPYVSRVHGICTLRILENWMVGQWNKNPKNAICAKYSSYALTRPILYIQWFDHVDAALSFGLVLARIY